MIVSDAATNPFWAETNRALMTAFDLDREIIEKVILQVDTVQDTGSGEGKLPAVQEPHAKDQNFKSHIQLRAEQADDGKSKKSTSELHPVPDPEPDLLAKIEKIKSRIAVVKKSSAATANTQTQVNNARYTPARAAASGKPPSTVPDSYRVANLRGTTAMPEGKEFLCNLASSPDFDPKYFDRTMPSHPDFGPKKHFMNFTVYLFFVIFAISFVSWPLVFMMISLGKYFDWTQVSLPLLAVALSLIAGALYAREANLIAAAWQRYATAILERAESKEIHARYVGIGVDNQPTVQLTYPNGFWELVYVRFTSDKEILGLLNNVPSVSMFRDKSGHASVVILEHKGHRIWCTGGRYVGKYSRSDLIEQ